MSSGTKIATGTGAARRRLTEAEAQAGCLPERMTAAEWTAAHVASMVAYGEAVERTRQVILTTYTIPR